MFCQWNGKPGMKGQSNRGFARVLRKRGDSRISASTIYDTHTLRYFSRRECTPKWSANAWDIAA